MAAAEQLKNEIDKFSFKMLEAGLAINFNYADLVRDRTNTLVTWKSSGSSARFLDSPFATVSEYQSMLKNEFFTIVLFDGSLLQISYTFRRDELLKHRLGYYPCPFLIDSELQAMDGLLDIIQAFDPYDFEDSLRLVSPLRFDFDPEQAKVNHPASHVHISMEECRLAMFAPLSLGHFIDFIFKSFYPNHWDDHDFIRTWARPSFNRCLDVEDRHHLYIDCYAKVM